MIDVDAVVASVRIAAESAGAEVWKVGASKKSDAQYVNIRKPRTMAAGWNESSQAWDGPAIIDEYWGALVRVSNHFNDTNTHERLTADIFINVCEPEQVEAQIGDLTQFLVAANCENPS